MTDKYETGRLYSGAYNNQQVIFIYAEDTAWGVRDEDGDVVAPSVEFITDVRGPLVVLDLPGIDLRDTARGLRHICTTRPGYRAIADQIEEQTRPPLQIGWHEVVHDNGVKAARYWDGTAWLHPGGGRDAAQEWTSTYYIGPGSGDQS